MTQSLEVNGYTAAAVLKALTTSGRTMRYRFEWLRSDNSGQGWLDNVVTGATVEHGYLRDIKRTISFSTLDNDGLTGAGFDYLNDRVRPWAGVLMPDGGYAEWAQGVFLASSPTRQASKSSVTRSVDGYDQTQILIDSTRSGVQTVAAGTAYTQALAKYTDVLPAVDIAASERTLAVDRSWDPGTSDFAIVTDLCAAINYSLAFDGFGTAQLQAYVDPTDSPATWTYDDTGTALMHDEISSSLDLAKVPNVFVLAVSQTDRPLMVSRVVNNDPSSPVSLASRGREIVSYATAQDVATQADLDDAARSAAISGANVYESLEFSSIVMPIHEDRDILNIVSTPLSLSGLFAETGWSFTMETGGAMKHTVRRAVPFDTTKLQVFHA